MFSFIFVENILDVVKNAFKLLKLSDEESGLEKVARF